MKIIVAVYSHPEYYPPTLNTVNALASFAEHVEMLCRNVKKDEITYNNNITLKKSGLFKNIRAAETASYFWKLKSFFHFTMLLFRTLKKTHPKWLIVYDPIPLLSYRLISFFLWHKPKLWYHNHDVLEISKLKKYSISWFACKVEQNSFGKIDLFTLPSEERKFLFPINKLKGQFIFLPNYPSIDLANQTNPIIENDSIKLIYQGHVGEGHGLDKLIEYISKKSLNITLSIIGNVDTSYEQSLITLIKELKLLECVKIFPPIAHHELIIFTRLHHIGLGIHEPKNIAFKTAATSSNKIYEYIACGLPVLLYDSNEYISKLKEKKWAFFTDLTFESIDNSITNILKDYTEISKSAMEDFKRNLYFEKHFSKVLPFVMDKK